MPLLSAAVGRRRFLTQLLSAALLPVAGTSESRTPASRPGTPAKPEPDPGPRTDRRHYTLIGVL